MTEIEIYHDFTHCNHYIPIKIINLKNHRQYIFQILRKNDQNLAKKAIFEFSQKMQKRNFFRLQRLGLIQQACGARFLD